MGSIQEIWRGDIIPDSGVDIAVGRNSLDFPSPTVPLLDVHLRRAELHDSGAPAQSGILSYNSHQDHELLELIPSQSGAQVVTPAVYIDIYNTSSEAIGNITNPDVLDLSVIRSVSSADHFTIDTSSPNGNFVSIWHPGTYEVTYRMSGDHVPALGGGTRITFRSWIETATDTGSFTEVAGSRAYSYHRIDTAGEDTAYITVILPDVVAGTRLQCLVGQNSTGMSFQEGPQFIPNGSSVTIKRLA